MRLQGNQDLTWKKVWFNDGALEGKSCLRNRLKISFGIHWVCYVIFGKKDPTKKITFPTLTPTKYFLDPQLQDIGDHLFCTLISENQGLEKLRSVSNLRKISGPAHLNFFSVDLIFFSVCHLNFFHVYGINLKKIQVTNWKKTQVYWKKNQVCRTWNFSKVWNRP